MEEVIAQLLPAEGAPSNRALLIQELSVYAQEIMREARRTGDHTPTAAESARALDWLQHPVFICGHHRSGTTLLQQLLDGHPQLVVLPSEGTYISSFNYVARRDPGPQEIDRFVADWIARLIDPNQEPHFKLGRSGLHGNPYVLFARRLLGWNGVLRQERPAFAEFALLFALVAAYRDVAAPSCTPSLWVEKTPLNEHNVRRFATVPQARFIQVVRDPAATLASLMEKYRKAGIREFNSAQHARGIGRSLQAARTNMQRLGSRYLVVRYEDLTHEPVREMERVRIFLGISAEPALSIPTVGGSAVRSNSSFDCGDAGVVQPSRGSPPLSPSDARLISTLGGPAARALGYDVAQPALLTRSLVHLRQLPAGAFRLIRAGLRGVWLRPSG
jgi:hypothetical protein